MEFIRIVIYASIYLGLIATTFYIISFSLDSRRKKLIYEDSELPKVSILIPAYNEEKTIEATINSILKSDYPKDRFEVIVIDDGSKDKTLEIAKKFESDKHPFVRVFTKKNGGKGTALNFGIKHAKGEIVFSMDADTFVMSQSMKNMVRLFKDPNIMSVTPAMLVKKPESIWQRVQHIEYLLGLFLRKAFASLNAIFITPGAFSAYRKSFFDKYGGYDEGNITEDLEMSMKIQYNGYNIGNCPEAPVYTSIPKDFKSLIIQRRRWYFGLLKNSSKYRGLLSRKYGDLGVFVFPIAWISIFFAVFLATYLFIKTIIKVRDELIFFANTGFDFQNIFHFNSFFIERALFLFFTDPVILFIFVFAILLGFYIYYASKKIGKIAGLVINLPLFFLFFSVLFALWWIVSIVYFFFAKNVKWR